MRQITPTGIRTCGCCRRELPIEAFYISKRTQHVDNYCKECRKSFTNNRYRGSKLANSSRSYPVITRTADPELRMALILNALQTVSKSVARKQQRVREAQETPN